jgi:hypothetical protein
MKKIYADKNEKLASIIHKIVTNREEEVTLFIPKGSIFERGEEDFHLLDREVRAAKKDLKIESFDESVLAMALAAGLKTEEPIFQGLKKPMADILPRRESHVHLEVEEKEQGEEEKESGRKPARKIKPKLNFRCSRPKFWIAGAAVLALIVGALIVLPKAEVDILFKKTPWIFDTQAVAKTSASQGSFGDKVYLPGQLFEFRKNSVYNFSASGEKYIESKATVELTVYNAYSSSSQQLVKSTRFVTPDGKVFRLMAGLTVPGAKIENGQIIPSSIVAQAQADKAGAEYNIGPVSRLNVPGFQGTAKYSGFYGEIKEKASGGFVGQTKVPTESDVASAKQKARQEITAALDLEQNDQMPAGFTLIEGAADTVFESEQSSPIADAQGNFQFTISAKRRLLAFRETDLLGVLTAAFVSKQSGDFILKDYKLTYRNAAPDFRTGQLAFDLNFSSDWIPQFSPEEFKPTILGLKEKRVRELCLGLPETERADIELWPFWVRSVPKNPNRVKIDYE